MDSHFTKERITNVIWGFMLENTYFIKFDSQNHGIIEEAYRQRKLRQNSHYITIQDSHLPAVARIYFGFAQVHLRMPGTRYHVKRRVVWKTSASRPLSSCTVNPSISLSPSGLPYIYPYLINSLNNTYDCLASVSLTAQQQLQQQQQQQHQQPSSPSQLAYEPLQGDVSDTNLLLNSVIEQCSKPMVSQNALHIPWLSKPPPTMPVHSSIFPYAK
ncbi:hypothetical protein EC973_004868 [Apophysomyces ossiformis]|uniref:Uncharacterized protein n=1 Tax=Apophysomyces ossiformis TaxID=679940 RepID=A0A8H7BKT8_9FUNG|nr:hypothetical protein EC973_004868 [Apophysomyces ossiformis]